MSVVSFAFLIFVSGVTLLYFLVPGKFQWVVLLIGSYVFYWMNSTTLLFVLLFTTCVTFFTGQWIEKVDKKASAYLKEHKEGMDRLQRKAYKAQKTKLQKRIVLLAAFLNLGLLIFLKYYNFLGENANSLLAMLHIEGRLPGLNLLLPMGISFYTLQSIAYILDIYHGKIEADRNIGKFSLFMSFFPQIIQGPIARYDQLAHQLYASHKFDYNRMCYGVQLMLWGFMKKLIVADRVAIAVQTIFEQPQQYTGFMILFSCMAYGLQIYCDFSGGIDIIRGAAQVWGVDMAENFRRPYFARSVDEFWRRWHISLGNFMRDYVFYPLSLSKPFGKLGKSARKVFGNYIGKKMAPFLATFITFLLVGIWHGSSWKYVAYGLWNGGIIVSSILLEPVYEYCKGKLKIQTECFSWKFFQAVRTAFLTGLGRIFPRAGSCMLALGMFQNMFAEFNPHVLVDGSLLTLGLTWADYGVILIFIVILAIVGGMQEKGISVREAIAGQNLYFRWMLYIGALVFLLICGVYGPGYDAAAFIYTQF